jgi:hypothetical protein
MMSRNIIIIINICLIVISIECRQSLRNYVVSQNYYSGEEFLVYDKSEQNLLCQMESSVYLFNRLTNLISYPSHQTIGSIRNVWSPFSNIFRLFFYLLFIYLFSVSI